MNPTTPLSVSALLLSALFFSNCVGSPVHETLKYNSIQSRIGNNNDTLLQLRIGMAQSEVREVMGKPERSEGYSWGSAWLYRTAMTSGVYGTEDTDFTIANGARVNEEDSKGQSPLDGALTHQRTETAVVLRKHGGKSTEELKAEGK